MTAGHADSYTHTLRRCVDAERSISDQSMGGLLNSSNGEHQSDRQSASCGLIKHVCLPQTSDECRAQVKLATGKLQFVSSETFS